MSGNSRKCSETLENTKEMLEKQENVRNNYKVFENAIKSQKMLENSGIRKKILDNVRKIQEKCMHKPVVICTLNIQITFKAYWPLTYLKMKRLGMKKM